MRPRAGSPTARRSPSISWESGAGTSTATPSRRLGTPDDCTPPPSGEKDAMDRTTHHTRNVAGLVAQRQALLAFLADLSPEAWDREVPGAGGATVKDVVAHLAERYAEALSGTLPPGDQGASDADVPSPAGRGAGDDPAGLLVELDQYATELESHFAERAGERWSLPAVAFGKLGGTSGMGVAGLLLDLHRHIHQISQAVGARVPVPEESRDATAAALAWLVGDKVEAPVQVVLED